MSRQQPPTPDLDAAHEPKLNIFALPIQTWILVVIVLGIIYGTLVSISANRGAPPLWPLMLGLFILSVLSWLAWPEQAASKHHFLPAQEEFPRLQACILYLARCVGVKRVPRLMISERADVLYIYGGWRRWHIGIGGLRAATMEDLLADPDAQPYVEAILLHELQHFKLGDHRLIGYTQFLLRMGYQFIGWASFFLLGLTLTLASMTDDFLKQSPAQLAARLDAQMPGFGIGPMLLAAMPSQDEWLTMRQQVATISFTRVVLYTFGNTYAILVISTVLILFFWSKMLRLRELYADARVAQLQGTSVYLVEARYVASPSTNIADPARIKQTSWQLCKANIQTIWALLLSNVPPLQRWLSTAPTPNQRKASLKDPKQVFDRWTGSALLIALAVGVLEQLMGGTAAIWYFAEWPLHVVVLSIFVLLSLNAIVGSVIGRPVLRENLKIINTVMALRAAVPLIIIVSLIILGPDAITSFLNFGAMWTLGVRSADQSSTAISTQSILLEMIGVSVAQLLITWIVLFGATWVQLQVTQRVLSWYGFPKASQWMMRIIYGSILMIACFLTLGILPIVTHLALLQFREALSPTLWIMSIVMLAVVIAAYGWFRWQDGRYRGRCPSCQTVLPDFFSFGRRCSVCGLLLHEWLYVFYSTELDE